MSTDLSYPYPPELLSLLIDTIPLLCPRKKDVFLFFRGSGVSGKSMREVEAQWKQDKSGVNKYEIVRTVLTNINEGGEASLRERREVLKRVIGFESFSACWPGDALKARGLVAEIQKVVNIKDSFTRMTRERDSERGARVARVDAERLRIRKRAENLAAIRDQMAALFGEPDPRKRGNAFEGVLNGLFGAFGIAVREAFTLCGSNSEGIVEQIDGVVEIDGHLYFVEAKWCQKPLGVPEISQHLVRVYSRAESRAIIISASGFTKPAIVQCQQTLQQKVVILCELHELMMLLERCGDLVEFLRKKGRAAQIDKNPFLQILA